MIETTLSRLTVRNKLLFPFLAFSVFLLVCIVASFFGNLALLFVLLLAGAALFSVLAVRIVRSIVDPLQQLKKGASEISHGNLVGALRIDTKDEFHDLAVSLNEIAAKHMSLVADLTIDKEAIAEQSERLEVATKLLFERDKELREYNDELVRDKEMIAAERNKLMIVLSGVRDAVIAVDSTRTIILVNKAACELTGYREEDLIGNPIDTMVTFSEQLDIVPASVYCPIRTDGFEGVVYQHEGLKMSGSANHQADVSLIAGQIKESKAINLGCILTLHDITQERQLEEMKLDFVSMAAHELRTPLTAIRGYAELVREEGEASMPAVQKEYLSRLIISAENLGNLIDNLLNVSRMEQGIFKLDVGKIDIVQLARTMVEAMHEQAKTKFQSLTLEAPQEALPPLLADKYRIGEVLSNLIANAISYTAPHGTIRVKIEQQKNAVAVMVIDTGMGIPAEALPKLFNKFFRVSGTLEQGSKGTGLGLFISKSIIRLHKGEIWVESKLGKGSTFTFTLPIPTAQDLSTHEQEKGAASPSGRSGTGIFINTVKP